MQVCQFRSSEVVALPVLHVYGIFVRQLHFLYFSFEPFLQGVGTVKRLPGVLRIVLLEDFSFSVHVFAQFIKQIHRQGRKDILTFGISFTRFQLSQTATLNFSDVVPSLTPCIFGSARDVIKKRNAASRLLPFCKWVLLSILLLIFA